MPVILRPFGELRANHLRHRDNGIRPATRMLTAVLTAILASAGCSDGETHPTMSCENVQAPEGPCAHGWELYESTVCSPPDINYGPSCGGLGDERCYQECATDRDCHDPCFPRCLSVPFGDGTDVLTYKSLCQQRPS